MFFIQQYVVGFQYYQFAITFRLQ